jgi:hypothetical protein
MATFGLIARYYSTVKSQQKYRLHQSTNNNKAVSNQSETLSVNGGLWQPFHPHHRGL